MTDDQCFKMAAVKLVLVKQKSCPVKNSFTHNVETGGDGSSVVRCFAGQRGRGGLGESDSRGSGNWRVWRALANARASVTFPYRL